jgi:ribokinase
MENKLSSYKPIVVVGSANLDLVAVAEKIPAVGETVIGSDFQIHPGGKGANQAVAIARLGYPVRFIGRLGSDSFGAQLRAHLDDAGVDIAGLADSDGASGVALIVVSSKGENSIVVTPGANAKVTPEDIADHLSIIRQAGLVLTQLEIPLDTVEYLASVCARESVPLILDPAPASLLPPAVFGHVEWFTPNESEAAFYITERNGQSDSLSPADIAEELLGKGCRGVVLKLGARGVYVVSQGSHGTVIPAFPVQAIDTTAAGDAFNGAFAVGLMLGKSPRGSANFAAAVAAISVTRIGAQPSLPAMPEVESFIRQHAAACS